LSYYLLIGWGKLLFSFLMLHLAGKYAVNFVPKESGVHYVHVLLNGNHVPGSPYPVQVGRNDADASQVRAYGDGLSKGSTGL